jgi:hypothetical protein
VELDDEVPFTVGPLVVGGRKNISGMMSLLGPRVIFSSPVENKISKCKIQQKIMKKILLDSLELSLLLLNFLFGTRQASSGA